MAEPLGDVMDEPVEAEPEDRDAPHGRCKVCRRALPAPARRSDGKGKGGRRRVYCPPPATCKERAAAERDARLASAIADPLALVVAVAEESAPAMTELATSLNGVLEALGSIEQNARQEVLAAREEVADAGRRVTAAEEQSADADERAVQAAAQATRAEETRRAAEDDARNAREQAAQAQRQAAETVAAHQQARDAAERAAQLSKQAEASLAERLDQATAQLTEERTARHVLRDELTGCRAELAEARAETRAAADSAERAHQDAAQRVAAAEQQSARLVTAAERATAAESARADRAEQDADESRGQFTVQRQATDQARRELLQLQARMQALTAERDAARADADHLRERAVTAEVRAQTLHEQLAAHQNTPQPPQARPQPE